MRVHIVCIAIATTVTLLSGTSKEQVEPNIPQAIQAETQEYHTIAQESPKTRDELDSMLVSIAKQKGLPRGKIDEIRGVIGGDPSNEICPHGESGWNVNAIGDGGRSFGIVQINLPAHPHITKAQAKNPEFALNFIVDEFKKGNEKKWTCWRAIYE